MFVLCICNIVTQWLGQEFDSQQFWQIPIEKKIVLIFGLHLLQIIFVLNINCSSYGMHMEGPLFLST